MTYEEILHEFASILTIIIERKQFLQQQTDIYPCYYYVDTNIIQHHESGNYHFTMSKLKTKNPCIVCCKQVKPKYGIQCRGACKKWAHFDCLNFSPDKIKDIRKGCAEIICPCPGCEANRQKNADEKCVNESCPENLAKECPSNPKVAPTCYPDTKKSKPATEKCPLCTRTKKKGSDCSLCDKIQASLPECPADLKCELKSAPKPKTCDMRCAKTLKRQKSPAPLPKGEKSRNSPYTPKDSPKLPCSPKGSPKPPCSRKGPPTLPCSPKESPKPLSLPEGSPQPPYSPKSEKSTKAQRSPNASKPIKLPMTDYGDDLGPSCCSLSCPSFGTEMKSQHAQAQCPNSTQNANSSSLKSGQKPGSDKAPLCPPRQSVSWSGLMVSNQNLKATLAKLVCTVKDLTSQVKNLMCEIKNMEQQKAK